MATKLAAGKRASSPLANSSPPSKSGRELGSLRGDRKLSLSLTVSFALLLSFVQQDPNHFRTLLLDSDERTRFVSSYFARFRCKYERQSVVCFLVTKLLHHPHPARRPQYSHPCFSSCCPAAATFAAGHDGAFATSSLLLSTELSHARFVPQMYGSFKPSRTYKG